MMLKQKRRPLRIVSGIYYKIRQAIFWTVTLTFLLLPWLQYNGRQAVLFDVSERIFFVFGLVFWPQNIIFFSLLLIIMALSMFIIAALGGRLFCGFLCPQTHFVAAFRAIGRLVNKLELGQKSAYGQVLSSVIKWVLISLSCFVLGTVMTGYFTPFRQLPAEVLNGHIWVIFWIIFFSMSIFVSCALMQEHICRYLCPYARFQGVMVDEQTLVVSYVGRGPNGPESREYCGKCSLCQVVCPASIDIRDGAQYACIGCSACIDACTTVSSLKGFETPMVQFSSIESMKSDQPILVKEILFRPRILGYLLLLLILCSVLVWMVSNRPLIKMNILRDRAVIVRVHDSRIENLYTCVFINQTEQTQLVELTIIGPMTATLDSKREIELPPLSTKKMNVTISVREGSVAAGVHPVDFLVQSVLTGQVFVEDRTTFLVSDVNY